MVAIVMPIQVVEAAKMVQVTLEESTVMAVAMVGMQEETVMVVAVVVLRVLRVDAAAAVAEMVVHNRRSHYTMNRSCRTRNTIALVFHNVYRYSCYRIV